MMTQIPTILIVAAMLAGSAGSRSADDRCFLGRITASATRRSPARSRYRPPGTVQHRCDFRGGRARSRGPCPGATVLPPTG
jgi:hypothetical protein